MELVLQHVRAEMRGKQNVIWIQRKMFELKSLTTIDVVQHAGFEFGGGAEKEDKFIK